MVEELLNSLYMDDVISEGEEISSLQELKSQMIFRDGGSELHIWHSNSVELEDYKSSDEVQTYAAKSLGAQNMETNILGLKWNKKEDLISMNFQPAKE